MFLHLCLAPEVLEEVHFADGAVHAAFQPLTDAAGSVEYVFARQLQDDFILCVGFLADRAALRGLADLHLLYAAAELLRQTSFQLRFDPSVVLFES